MFLTTFMTAELRGVSVERIAAAGLWWSVSLDRRHVLLSIEGQRGIDDRRRG